jgi:transcriptional regulator with XRE-family HTH domain
MADLRMNLKKKLVEQNLTASALERKAGIRPSSLQNIIQGRSKNPGVDILQRTAAVLKCTVSDLLGEKPGIADVEAFCAVTSWDQNLYTSLAALVLKVYADKEFQTSKRVFLHTLEQVYTYCLQYQKPTVDPDFVDWTVRKLVSSEAAGEL